MDKRKFWGSILGTTMFIVMILGLTYAYYTWRSSDTSLTFSISDAYFKCQSGIETHTTSLEPVNDYKLGSYQTFTVNNIGMTDTTFSLTMDITSIDEELIAEDVKYKLVVDETGGSNDCTTTDCTLVGEGSFANAIVGMNTLVSPIFIPNNVNYKYYLFIYIDGEMSENSNRAGNSINGTLEVCEIVVFLDYQGGNSTQSFLKVTDTYEDLPTSVTRNDFTITYEENGGTSVTDGTITYTFEGWYTEPSGGGSLITPTTEVSKTTNHTLYAKWSNTCVSLPSITKTGYTFNGWYSDSSLTKRVGGAGDNYCEATEKLYAGWTANQYTVAFDPNGGTLVSGNIGSSKTVTYDSTYGELPSATREGYVFGGWNTKTDGTGTTITDATTVTTASNHTLYANWNVVDYEITYNNANKTAASVVWRSNSQATLMTWEELEEQYEFEILGVFGMGWEFVGWSTEENGTTIAYGDGASFGYLTGDLELYAVYGRDIIFKYGENVSESFTSSTQQLWNPNDDTGTSVQSPSIPNILICSDGTTSGCDENSAISVWTVLGFRNDTTPGSAEYEQNSNIAPSITETNILYAVYSRSLRFISGSSEATRIDGGRTQFLNSYTNSVSTVKAYTPSAITNWTSLGYRDDTTPSSYEYTCSKGSSTCQPLYNGGSTLYAVYSRTLTVSYDGNGNTGGSTPADHTSPIYLNTNSTTTSNQTLTLTINTFTKTDHTFVAWAEGSISGTQYTASSSYNPNLAYNSDNFEITMYAIWEEIPKVITYYNGSTNIGTSTCKSGENITLKTWSSLGTTVTGSTYGWSFGYWTDSQDSYVQKNTDGQTISCPSSDISLYSVYSRTITFKSGVSAATTSTATQYWNSYGSTNGTHLSGVTAPALASITNWTPAGYSHSTNATGAAYTVTTLSTTIYPARLGNPILYGTYRRTLKFYSGVNKATTDGTRIQYLNSSNNTVSAVTAYAPTAITNWTTLGYRTDTTTADYEYSCSKTSTSCAPPYTSGNDLYGVYSRTLTVSYNGNGNTGGTAIPNTTKTIYLNTNSTTTSDQTVTLALNSYAKIGHTFTSWSDGTSNYDENATYNPNLAYNASSFDITMSANWTTGIYTITLSTQLATSNSNYSAYICEKYGVGMYLGCNVTVTYVMTMNSNPIIIPVAANGYVFQGYYTEVSGGVQLIDSSGYITSNFTSTYFTESATLYAQWELPSYDITYYNGSTKLEVSTCKKGETITLKTWDSLGATVTNSTYGWEFGYWANASNTYAQTYADGATISCPSSNTTIYAVYSRDINFYKLGNLSADEPDSSLKQYWNPYGSTSGTHLSGVTAPGCYGAGDDALGWDDTANMGYRNDTDYGEREYLCTGTIYPARGGGNNLYQINKRTVTFKSGVNAGTTDGTATQYLNKNMVVSYITAKTPTTITNWTALGYRPDTTAGNATNGCTSGSTTCAPVYTDSPTLYGVYKRDLTFYSGVNKATTHGTRTQYLNSSGNTVSAVTAYTPTAITNWTALGYRTDTTANTYTNSCSNASTTCKPAYDSGNSLYGVYSRTLTVSYNGNGNTGGTAPSNTTKTIYLNTNSTTTSDQSITLPTNTFTKDKWNFYYWAEGSADGASYDEGETYNPNLAYDASSFTQTMYVKWKGNGAKIRYNVNGGTITSSTTDGTNTYTWTTDDSTGLISRSYNGGTATPDFMTIWVTHTGNLADYNNSAYINITKSGVAAKSGAEWICLSGCVTANQTYDQTATYDPEDFCDITDGSCTVVLGVNWETLSTATISTTNYIWNEPGYLGKGAFDTIQYYPSTGTYSEYSSGTSTFNTIQSTKLLGTNKANITVYIRKDDSGNPLDIYTPANYTSRNWIKFWAKKSDLSLNTDYYADITTTAESTTINGTTYYAVYAVYGTNFFS